MYQNNAFAKNQLLQIALDSESVNIYRQINDDDEPLHIVYWHEDEWLEDAESVVPAMIKAIELYYTDQIQLLKVLGLEQYLI